MTNTIHAAENPAMVNDMLSKLDKEAEKEVEVSIQPPSDTTVNLPGGYVLPTGEVIRTAEVRELTGRDEEAIARASNPGRVVLTVLQRGLVKVGNLNADEALLDKLLSGDRDMILLGIFKATFGKTADINTWCGGCSEIKIVQVDIDKDIPVKVLVDPVADRIFTVKGKRSEFTVQLPTGVVQRELLTATDKNSAELATILLENTLLQIDGQPVLSKLQVQNLNMVDRRTILDAVNARVVGPQFDDLTVACPDCEGEVVVPVNLGTLFQLQR